MTLKDRIKELADKENLSLPALESKLGFGNGTITKWDKSTPNADKLNAVAQHFHVTMDYLLNGSVIEQYATSQLNNRVVDALEDYFDDTPLEICVREKLYICDTNFIRNINTNDEHYYEIDEYFKEKLNMSILTLQEILNMKRFVTSLDLAHIITGFNVSIEKLLLLPIPPYKIAKDTFIKASFHEAGYFTPITYTIKSLNEQFMLAINNENKLDCFNINIDMYNTLVSSIDDFILPNVKSLLSKSEKVKST